MYRRGILHLIPGRPEKTIGSQFVAEAKAGAGAL
jgi:hypothetical protein